MASAQQPVSSGGSDGGDQRYAHLDEKSRKRKISNRESARRSRMKKQQHVDEQTGQVGQLQNNRKMLMLKIVEVTDLFVGLTSANNVLRAQLAELTDRLYSLNSVIRIAEEANGFAIDIPEIPQALLEPWQLPCPVQLDPWQLPCPVQPIGTSVNLFHC